MDSFALKVPNHEACVTHHHAICLIKDNLVLQIPFVILQLPRVASCMEAGFEKSVEDTENYCKDFF